MFLLHKFIGISTWDLWWSCLGEMPAVRRDGSVLSEIEKMSGWGMMWKLELSLVVSGSKKVLASFSSAYSINSVFCQLWMALTGCTIPGLSFNTYRWH